MSTISNDASLSANKLNTVTGNTPRIASVDSGATDGDRPNGIEIDTISNTKSGSPARFKSITISESTEYTFRIADFSFSDPDSVRPSGIEIDTISNMKLGSFVLLGDDTPLGPGDFISVDIIELGEFSFSPAADTTGSCGFTFHVLDNESFDWPVDKKALVSETIVIFVNAAANNAKTNIISPELPSSHMDNAHVGIDVPNHTPATRSNEKSLGIAPAYGGRSEKEGNCGHFPAKFEDNSELFDENLREKGGDLPLSQPIHPKSDRRLEQNNAPEQKVTEHSVLEHKKVIDDSEKSAVPAALSIVDGDRDSHGSPLVTTMEAILTVTVPNETPSIDTGTPSEYKAATRHIDSGGNITPRDITAPVTPKVAAIGEKNSTTIRDVAAATDKSRSRDIISTAILSSGALALDTGVLLADNAFPSQDDEELPGHGSAIRVGLPKSSSNARHPLLSFTSVRDALGNTFAYHANINFAVGAMPDIRVGPAYNGKHNVTASIDSGLFPADIGNGDEDTIRITLSRSSESESDGDVLPGRPIQNKAKLTAWPSIFSRFHAPGWEPTFTIEMLYGIDDSNDIGLNVTMLGGDAVTDGYRSVLRNTTAINIIESSIGIIRIIAGSVTDGNSNGVTGGTLTGIDSRVGRIVPVGNTLLFATMADGIDRTVHDVAAIIHRGITVTDMDDGNTAGNAVFIRERLESHEKTPALLASTEIIESPGSNGDGAISQWGGYFHGNAPNPDDEGQPGVDGAISRPMIETATNIAAMEKDTIPLIGIEPVLAIIDDVDSGFTGFHACPPYPVLTAFLADEVFPDVARFPHVCAGCTLTVDDLGQTETGKVAVFLLDIPSYDFSEMESDRAIILKNGVDVPPDNGFTGSSGVTMLRAVQ
ncbi:MAG: hypothetical protein HKP13_00595 [Gammaproteobacteria bacterium]|nr:hypothetical protein [Gammaproteobacteria bacterium]